MKRRFSRNVVVGGVPIGGDATVSVQTMNRAPVDDVEANLAELRAAAAAGCDISRMAVPSVAAAKHFGRIAARSPLPLVADTHFDWRVTLAAIDEGAAKVRINPGNMSGDGLARIVDAAGEKGIPLRIGGNSGSIKNRSGKGDARDTATALAEETLRWAETIEAMGFHHLVLSLKAHSAAETVAAYRLAAKRSDLPLHLGVTAAGTRDDALFKSVAAIGALLLDGIGDTIRFSFTGDAPGEIAAGLDLLRALDLRRDAPVIVSCPACGRCRVALPALAAEVKKRLAHLTAPLRIAVMGCEVNGPGEATTADLGIASAGGVVHLFVKGEVIGKIPVEKAVDALVAEAEKMAAEHGV